MTPSAFKAIRERCGLTQPQLAAWLGFSRNGDRHIRAIESGERQPSGPVVVLMQALGVAQEALNDPQHELHQAAVKLAGQGYLPFTIERGNNG